jgi:hypothetical protein
MSTSEIVVANSSSGFYIINLRHVLTNIDNVKNYLIQDIDEDYEPQVYVFIDAVTAYISRFTGRPFSYDTQAAATTKLYDGTGDGELVIDDAVEVTGVSLYGEALDPSEYYLYPANSTPKTKIILPYRTLPLGNQVVSVSAKWGYGEDVPDDLSFAATVLVAGIINTQRASEGGEVVSESIGGYSVTYKAGSSQANHFTDAMKIIKLYKRYT